MIPGRLDGYTRRQRREQFPNLASLERRDKCFCLTVERRDLSIDGIPGGAALCRGVANGSRRFYGPGAVVGAVVVVGITGVVGAVLVDPDAVARERIGNAEIMLMIRMTMPNASLLTMP